MAKSFWSITVREARAQAIILSVGLWSVAIVLVAWPGSSDPFGKVKFPDFVHFYVLGNLASHREFDRLYDADAQYERQLALIPASRGDRFVPVYGPQTALIFAPFSQLSFSAAGFAWAALTILVYGASVRVAWRSVSSAIPDRRLVAAAAAGFPPFWNLVLHGQSTLVPLAAFLLAWLALERGRKVLAGVAFGLLAIKPQFGLVIASVALLCGEWKLIVGALCSIGAQASAVMLIAGAEVLQTYLSVLVRVPEFAAALEPRPYQLHSIRAITTLLPGLFGEIAYGTAVAGAIWAVVRVWKTGLPIAVRLATLIVASCLASPHLTVYDLTVLALPILWLGGWVSGARPALPSDRYWWLIYALFVSLLVPTALLIRFQVSVALLSVLFVLVVRSLLAAARDNPPVRAAVG